MAAANSEDSPRPVSRACDRCRRRKAKVGNGNAATKLRHKAESVTRNSQCDCPDPSSACVNCSLAGEQCTFNLPLSRRGPKGKRRHLAADARRDSLHRPVTPSLQITRHRPPSRGIFDAPASSESLDLWESGITSAISLDPALSPATVHTVPTPLSHPASTPGAVSVFQRWDALARELYLRRSTAKLENVVNKCFKLFFDYLFPLIPLVHESSLRDGLEFFVSRDDTRALRGSISNMRYGYETLKYPELWPDVSFTLITAVCAETAFLLPKDIFPEGEIIADIFLQASRSCLVTYLEADLEHPNANSVAIRYLHSNCMHAAGKPRFSWHVFGEATRLAQVLQMHDEESIQGLHPLEAEFRRRAFWITYIGDKSAAILNNRPITIHKFSFESGITVGYPTGIEDENIVSPGSTGADDLTVRSSSFIIGFNANLRLWQTASDLLLEMRLLESRKNLAMNSHHSLTADERLRLDHLYVLFVTSLDDLPPFLQDDQLVTNAHADREEMSNLVRLYTIQAANLYVSLHCLKMVIMQKFEEVSYFPMGHNEMLLLRKTEIARNMLRIMREAPFWALQVNGEPCVSYLHHKLLRLRRSC